VGNIDLRSTFSFRFPFALAFAFVFEFAFPYTENFLALAFEVKCWINNLCEFNGVVVAILKAKRFNDFKVSVFD